MEMNVIIGKVDYLITDESTIHQGEDLIFEIRNRSSDNSNDSSFIVGSFDDLLGSPIKKVWKIIGQTSIKNGKN
jgi:hypothetical protein